MEEFLHFWKSGQNKERAEGLATALVNYELAASLYKGDFLEEDIYESWPALQRENLKEIYLVILDKLSRFYALDGKPQTAIDLCEAILEKDNCREDIYRRLMHCYYKIGQRDKAIKQYRRCVEILSKELEIEPTPTTIELYKKIKNGQIK